MAEGDFGPMWLHLAIGGLIMLAFPMCFVGQCTTALLLVFQTGFLSFITFMTFVLALAGVGYGFLVHLISRKHRNVFYVLLLYVLEPFVVGIIVTSFAGLFLLV